MFKISHNEFSELIKEYYKKKLALFCFGAFGIGKSFVVRNVAKKIAEERERIFIEWDKISKAKKQEVYDSPKKYFTLIDIRLSEFDASDFKLPDFKEGKETIIWKIPFWEHYMTLPNSDGILFMDELNLGTPMVMSSCYKLLYDRCVNDVKMSENWLILGAGNRDSDRGFTHTIPEPLLDRGGCCELVKATTEEWIKNFAIPNKIDSRIIGYLSFKEGDLQKINFSDNQKQTTCRGWERLSNLIKGVKNYPMIELLCKSAIGEGIAISFISFLKIQEKMKLDDVIKHPEKIEKIEKPDVMFFLVSAVSEKYGDKNNKQVDFDKVIAISKVLDEMEKAEFCVLLWRLCLSYAGERFKKDFLNSKEDKMITKYGRFIV